MEKQKNTKMKNVVKAKSDTKKKPVFQYQKENDRKKNWRIKLA